MKNSDQINTWIQQHKFDNARAALLNSVRTAPRDAASWELLSQLMAQMDIGATARHCFVRFALLQPLKGGSLQEQPAVLHALSDQVDDEVEDCLLVPKKSVGVAMIVKNASRTIVRSLTALLPAVDQIVIVDTGSTDDTVAMVRSLNIDVRQYEWKDDFADSRNHALSFLKTDWALSIDSDEILDQEDIDSVRTVVGLFDDLPGSFALQLFQMNQIGDMVSPRLETRMFPTERGIRWFRPIHEQLVTYTGEKIPAYPVRIRVFHDGYDPRVVDTKQKYRRNVIILTRHIEQVPNDAVSHAFLGREHLLLDHPDEAIKHLQTAKELFAKDASLPKEALLEVERNLVLAYEKMGNYELSLHLAEQMTTAFPKSVDAWYLSGYYHLRDASISLQSAISDLQHAMALAHQGQHMADPTVGQFKALLHLADATRLSGDWIEARKLYEQVLAQIPDFSEVLAILQKMEQQAQAYIT